jgi:hypothetical protein
VIVKSQEMIVAADRCELQLRKRIAEGALISVACACATKINNFSMTRLISAVILNQQLLIMADCISAECRTKLILFLAFLIVQGSRKLA